MDAPGLCSPSRKVVSKIINLSLFVSGIVITPFSIKYYTGRITALNIFRDDIGVWPHQGIKYICPKAGVAVAIRAESSKKGKTRIEKQYDQHSGGMLLLSPVVRLLLFSKPECTVFWSYSCNVNGKAYSDQVYLV